VNTNFILTDARDENITNMLLQKINYNQFGTVICAIDTIQNGGEFTICGNNSIDAGKAEDDDWDIIGERFNGKLKQVTCPNCLRFIQFIKNLK